MGYDANIIAFKKKELDNIRQSIPEFTHEDMYTSYKLEEYIHDIGEGDIERINANWIYSPKRDVFSEFFKTKNIKFDEYDDFIVVNEETYNNFYAWIENKLSRLTLLDVINSEKEEDYFEELKHTYKNMRDKKIDFETEFVIFEHDW